MEVFFSSGNNCENELKSNDLNIPKNSYPENLSIEDIVLLEKERCKIQSSLEKMKEESLRDKEYLRLFGRLHDTRVETQNLRKLILEIKDKNFPLSEEKSKKYQEIGSVEILSLRLFCLSPGYEPRVTISLFRDRDTA